MKTAVNDSCTNITIEKLKEMLLESHYTPSAYDYVERKLIITPIINGYGTPYDIFFSMEGSPPKGRAVFSVNYQGSEGHFGDLYILPKHSEAKGKRLKHVQIEGIKFNSENIQNVKGGKN